MTVSKLAGKVAESAMEYAGEIVNIKYYPNRYTPALMADLLNIVKLAQVEPALKASENQLEQVLGFAPEMLNGISDALAKLLHSWDLEGDDGQPYPVTREALRYLPFDFLATVLGHIRDLTSATTEGKA